MPKSPIFTCENLAEKRILQFTLGELSLFAAVLAFDTASKGAVVGTAELGATALLLAYGAVNTKEVPTTY